MSLLEEAMTDCVMMDKRLIEDGYGGYKRIWTEGIHIQCAILLNNSIEAQIAQKQGTTAYYTVTTKKELNLQYHDVIKRVNDNKFFLITSDGDDNYTPNSATLNMRQVSAEEWSLPNE